jgi:DHA3 family macrolide efflux protein-like MFS transporter
MATPVPTLSLKEVLRLRPVRRLWAAQVVSIFGDFLAIFAIYSVVSFRMHATATEISLILVSFLLPLAIVGPVAGVFVDHWNVKRTMIASDLIRAVLAALLVAATDVREIYVIFFALGSVSSFFIPAQSVTLRTIVPHAGLMSANALMQNAIQLMQIISPAIAGVLVASVSAKACFWLDSLSFIFSASMVYTLTIDREPSRKPLNLSIVNAEMNAGMKFIFTHSAVSFVILSLMAGMFVIRCFFALIAVYVRDVLRGGSALFGSISSLVGVGIIAGTQLIRHFAREKSKGHLVILGLVGIGISIMLMAAFANIPVTMAATLGIGFWVGFLIVPTQVLLQEETPKEMLGRVSSSLMSVMSISQVLAMSGAGPLAQTIGIRNLYYLSAALLLATAAFGYSRIPKHA